MNKIFLLAVGLAVGFSSCDQKQSSDTNSEVKDTKVSEVEKEEEFLGEAFNEEEETDLDILVKDMDTSDSVIAMVETKVSEVCQSKGCWMKVELPNGESMRVTFKDYGFFMPKDLAGQSVKMMGTAKIEETDIETLKHFAEDAGKSEEEIAMITEPRMDYKFVASGVKIVEQE
jgi:hypothetical protein